MKRGRIRMRAVLFLILLGLSLSACAGRPRGYVYGGYPAYPYPAYDAFAFDYGGWGGWHHGWDHSHWDHDGRAYGFAHGGFGEHGGFGGGGHR
jgi:hypothetical protein